MRELKKRSQWTQQEDDLLREAVNNCGGPHKWNVIATFVPNHSGKQCRERWISHISPEVNKKPFSFEEDTKLVELVKSLGTSWSVMKSQFTNRSSCALKNRYLTLVRHDKAPKPHVWQTDISISHRNEAVLFQSPTSIGITTSLTSTSTSSSSTTTPPNPCLEAANPNSLSQQTVTAAQQGTTPGVSQSSRAPLLPPTMSHRSASTTNETVSTPVKNLTTATNTSTSHGAVACVRDAVSASLEAAQNLCRLQLQTQRFALQSPPPSASRAPSSTRSSPQLALTVNDTPPAKPHPHLPNPRLFAHPLLHNPSIASTSPTITNPALSQPAITIPASTLNYPLTTSPSSRHNTNHNTNPNNSKQILGNSFVFLPTLGLASESANTINTRPTRSDDVTGTVVSSLMPHPTTTTTTSTSVAVQASLQGKLPALRDMLDGAGIYLS